jgi:hypothetical protein
MISARHPWKTSISAVKKLFTPLILYIRQTQNQRIDPKKNRLFKTGS